MRIKAGYFAIAIFGALLLLKVTVQAAPSKGESLLNKGDSIAVYVDAEDFDAIKAAKKGAIVKLKVLENVVRSGEKLINKGDAVFATVTGRSHGGMYGGAGNAKLTIDSTYSNAKTRVPLKGQVILAGKGKGILPYIPPIILIGWLLKGGDIEPPEGGKNVYKPVVAEDTPVYYQR
jgi:hypothetical protein